MAVVAGTLPGLDIDEQIDEAALEQQIAAQLMGCKTHNAARNQKKRQKQKERKAAKETTPSSTSLRSQPVRMQARRNSHMFHQNCPPIYPSMIHGTPRSSMCLRNSTA
jgi:hypothetical protein